MFASGRKGIGSGNKYVFIVIIMILGIVYIMGRISPDKEVVFPVNIQYDGRSYQYAETFKGSPFMFKRSRPASAEGFFILSRRGIKASEEIYIYEGHFKYRRYVVVENAS